MIHLVVGPPCGGKSTYVDTHADDGDIVIDYDLIARGLGSPNDWQHDEWYGHAANAEVDRRIAELTHESEAWVIRCLPGLGERAHLAARLSAEVVVCDPGEAVCLDRAHARPSGTRKAIRMWYWRARRSSTFVM